MRPDYSNKVCPYCRTRFLPADEVVLCSICEMTHHLDCWVENQSCTTFGCQGTIDRPGMAPTSVTSREMEFTPPVAQGPFCGYCGTRNTPDAVFCQNCGNRMMVSQASPVPQPFGANIYGRRG